MKTLSKNARGQEKYELFFSETIKNHLLHYDYRDIDGELFSTVAKDLDHARDKKDRWLKQKQEIIEILKET